MDEHLVFSISIILETLLNETSNVFILKKKRKKRKERKEKEKDRETTKSRAVHVKHSPKNEFIMLALFTRLGYLGPSCSLLLKSNHHHTPVSTLQSFKAFSYFYRRQPRALTFLSPGILTFPQYPNCRELALRIVISNMSSFQSSQDFIIIRCTELHSLVSIQVLLFLSP